MRAGQMDRRIVIQDSIRTDAPDGSPVTEWREVAKPWARVRDLRASERRQSDQVMPVRSAVMEIHYRAGLHQAMRVVYDGLAWEIVGIAEIGRRAGLEITAQAVGP